MTTLYIRDVSEAVAETLKQRAAAQGKSLSAYVGAELAKIAARPTNEEIVARLRAQGVLTPRAVPAADAAACGASGAALFSGALLPWTVTPRSSMVTGTTAILTSLTTVLPVAVAFTPSVVPFAFDVTEPMVTTPPAREMSSAWL